jgi:coenzyme F420-0:L-glutamate ligase/coenzyme F420-1:gamma-L-glutamate ligase
VILPRDPDASARRLREALVGAGCGPLAVIVTDTFGRPWREGLVDVALGVAGIAPLDDQRGSADRRGRELQVTIPATADALAAAAGLLMKKADGVPAVWITGVELRGDGSARQLIRDTKLDLFR